MSAFAQEIDCITSVMRTPGTRRRRAAQKPSELEVVHQQFFGGLDPRNAADSLPFVESHDVAVDILDRPLTARARQVSSHGQQAAIQYEFKVNAGTSDVALLHIYLHPDGLVSLDSMGMAAIGQAGAVQMRHELTHVLQRAYRRSVLQAVDD